MKSIVRVICIVTFLICVAQIEMLGQCPMCRMASESNLANGGTAGKGLNTGILYMLAMPYVLIGVISFLWLKNRKKDDDFDVATT